MVLIGVIGYLIVTREDGAAVAEERAPAPAVVGEVPGSGETAAVGGEVVKYVTATMNIRNVATAEGPDSRVMGSVQRGQQVRGVMVQGLSGDSFWFRLSDGRGYVSAINLSDGPPAAEAPPPVVVRAPVAYGSYCTVATSQSSLRIRRSAGGAIIGGLPRGTQVQAFDQVASGRETWVYVVPQRAGYASGWVAVRFLSC